MKHRRCFLVLTLAMLLSGCAEERRSAPPLSRAAEATTAGSGAAPAPPPAATAEQSPAPPPLSTGATATPPVGPAPTPLRVEAETELPANLAVIVETGCYQCDGPAADLIRIYRDPTGTLRSETLFQGPAGDPSARYQPYISGILMTRDASDMVLAICTRGYCGPLNAVDTGAPQTTLIRSRDGGVTWSGLAVYEGAVLLAALLRDGIVYSGPYPARDPEATTQATERAVFRRLPGDQEIEPPADLVDPYPVALADGTLGWRGGDGRRLVRADGGAITSPVLPPLPPGARWPSLLPNPYGGPAAITWFEESPGEPPSASSYRIGLLDANREIARLYASRGPVGIGLWLDERRALGKVSVPPGSLTTLPPVQFGGYLPAIIDLEAGTARPIIAGFPPGRAAMHAFMRGPFARVQNAGAGDCLNVRAEPRPDAPALACVADRVLLRHAGESRLTGGESWRRVVTPTGVEGWANATYLEY